MLDLEPSKIKCTRVLVDLEPSVVRLGPPSMISPPEMITPYAILKSRHAQLKIESRVKHLGIVQIVFAKTKTFLNIFSHLNLKDALFLRLICRKFNNKISQFVVNKLPASILEKIIPKKQNDINKSSIEPSCSPYSLSSTLGLPRELVSCENELPNELIALIFSNLGVPSLCNAMLVCKTWKILAEDVTLWSNRLPKAIDPSKCSEYSKYKVRVKDGIIKVLKNHGMVEVD